MKIHLAKYLWKKEKNTLSENAKLGDTIFDPLPPIDFGRVAAQTAKQVIIVQRVKEADKEPIQ